MSIRTFTVLVGTWGASPSFSRDETITVDSEAKPPFPYDVDVAVASGVLAEITDESTNASAVTPAAAPAAAKPAAAAKA